MNCMDHHRSDLMQVLSDRLLQDFPRDVWRRTFLGATPPAVRFTREEITFLCTDAPGSECTAWGSLAGRGEAVRHQPEGDCPTLRFPGAQQALEAALRLQRGASRPLRCALVTMVCTMAAYEVDGVTTSLSLGCEDAVMQAHVGRVPPGTIHLCAQTCARLGDVIDSQARGGLLATELEGDRVTSAAITLPPSYRAALSTFAGLGLT